MESFQIHFCSSCADTINNDNNCDCIFNLPQIEINSQSHIYLSVVHASIPYSFYQINTTNNFLSYSYNGIINDFYITPGNYNVYELGAYLESNLPNTTVTYSPITNTYTFTCTTNVNFTFYYNSTCLEILGFTKNSNVYSSNYVLTSTQAVNLSPTNCICIMTNLNTYSFNKANTNSQNILCSIPIDVARNGIIVYNNQNGNYKANVFTNIIGEIAIKFCDQDGNLLDINNAIWTLTIQFDIINFVE